MKKNFNDLGCFYFFELAEREHFMLGLHLSIKVPNSLSICKFHPKPISFVALAFHLNRSDTVIVWSMKVSQSYHFMPNIGTIAL